MAKDEQEEGGSVELVTIESPEQIARLLAGLQEFEQSEEEATARGQEAAYEIVMQMLAAETEEELWRELPRWSSKDCVGETFRITDARPWRSKYKGANGTQGAFLSCSAVNVATGELGIVNTSAMRIAGRILWYKLHDRLPVTLTFTKVGETAAGYTILDAELAE